MASLQSTLEFLSQRRHWCMSLLRIYLGLGLFVKAVTFVRDKDELVRMLEENDVFWAGVGLAHWIILSHLLGGLLMAIGLGTRVAALIQLPNLIAAVFFVHLTGGIFGFAEELRFSALVLFLLLLFVWHGSGPLSLDETRREHVVVG